MSRAAASGPRAQRGMRALCLGGLALGLAVGPGCLRAPRAPLEELHALSDDDNPCAEQVERQLRTLFRAPRRLGEALDLEWRRSYPPLAFSARDALIGPGIFSKVHVQGITRTYSDALPLALSHDTAKHGAVLIAARAPHGLVLDSIHPLRRHHPSGVQAIGSHVAVVDGNDLVLIDLARPSADRVVRIPGRRHDLRKGGGGIAMLKLAARRHLLAVTYPGSRAEGPRTTAFFRLDGGLRWGARLKALGTDSYRPAPTFPKGRYELSENLSLVRECGTDQLFALHTTGPDRLRGRGYYRLSRITGLAGQPTVTPLAVYELTQDQAACHLRSAATAFVTPSGAIELVCSEHAAHMGLGLRSHGSLRFSRFVAEPSSAGGADELAQKP